MGTNPGPPWARSIQGGAQTVKYLSSNALFTQISRLPPEYTLKRSPRRKPTSDWLNFLAVATARLEGAPTDSIRRGIADVFDSCDVETIAPGYGCILRGRNVVKRHVRMLDEVLKALDKSVAVSRYVGRDEER